MGHFLGLNYGTLFDKEKCKDIYFANILGEGVLYTKIIIEM